MKKKYFEVLNAAGAVPTILVYGQIPDRDKHYDRINDAGSLVNAISQLEAAGNNRIDIRINSPGGSFFDALAVAAAIARSTAEIHTYNDGIAYSAAFIMFVAGKKRYAAKGSFFMAHNASFGCLGGNAKDLAAAAAELAEYDEGAIEMLAGVSKMTADEIRTAYYQYTDVVMGAEKALTNGFVEEILPFGAQNVPAGIENMSLKAVAALFEEDKKPASWIDRIANAVKSAFAAPAPQTNINEEQKEEPMTEEEKAEMAALKASIAAIQAEAAANKTTLDNQIQELKAKPATTHTAPVKSGTDHAPATADDGVDWEAMASLKHNIDADKTNL
jgi:ATP-dependent Clp protease, protease subunit